MKQRRPNALKGKARRIYFGVRVDPNTAAHIHGWQKAAVSQGVLIDRLVAHAARTNFNPAVDCL